MSVPRLQGLDPTQDLIHQLNTTTFESSYTEQHLNIDNQPPGIISMVKRAWARVWLKIACFIGSGWRAGDNVAGIGSLQAERVCVKSYTSKLDALITHLAKTPIINPEYAAKLGVPAEPATSSKDKKNKKLRLVHELNLKIGVFYQALKKRVEQLEPEFNENQVALYKAGLQQVTDKIHEHNTANKTPFIRQNSDVYLNEQLKEAARMNLAKQITPIHITGGLKAMADTINCYVQSFDSNDETIESLVDSVREEIIATRSREFDHAINELRSEASINSRTQSKREALSNQEHETQKRIQTLENTIDSIQNNQTRQEEILTEMDRLEQFDQFDNLTFEKIERYLNNSSLTLDDWSQMTMDDQLQALEEVEERLRVVNTNDFDSRAIFENCKKLCTRVPQLNALTTELADLRTALFQTPSLHSLRQELAQREDKLEQIESDLDIDSINSAVEREISDEISDLSLFISKDTVDSQTFFKLVYPLIE